MTRGYIVLLINGKIYKVVESYGDSYLEELGLQILNLIEEGKLEEALHNVQPINQPRKNLKSENAIDLIWNNKSDKLYNSIEATMDWFVKSQNNKNDYFYDYIYMYDLKKDILTVYYYGKKLFSIARNKIEYYKCIFANEEKIYNVICYNEKQANNSNDWLMAMKKLCKECNT